MKTYNGSTHNTLQLHIRGGLGNQLFQLTGALFHARRLSADLFVNETALVSHKDKSRQNWINQLNLETLTSGTNLKWIKRNRFNLDLRMKKFREIDEEQISKLSTLHENLSFRGWFQTSSFSSCLNFDRRALNPLFVPAEIEASVSEISNSEELLGVHMRFGDFKDTSWGTLSQEWYLKTFDLLDKQGIKHAHVYSDEIEIAKKLLRNIPRKFSLDFPEEKQPLLPHELLWTLRHYKTFVSSNSTLSWWASYLNMNENPVIYCPWEKHMHIKPWIKI
jgi:hypothetical protein